MILPLPPRLASLAAALVLIGSTAADAAVGEWSGGDHSRVRLVAAGIGDDGLLDAAIEIELDPGWKTYWRTPGDAGIAPVIDFSASTNLGSATVAYPLPHRYDDGFGISNVYEDHVVLPVKIPVVAKGAPVTFAVALDIGVCEEVCIPVHFDASLDVPQGAPDADAAAIVAAARAVLPGPPEPGVIAVEHIRRDGGTDRKPVFALTLRVPDPAGAEIYVEPPADWYGGMPKLVSNEGGLATYSVQANRLGAKTPIEGAAFRVTIVSGDRAVEQTVGLD